jgi:HAD superfamily hydrolase (TIGR01490 family)
LIEAAIFDVDHTITKHATGLKYLPMLLRKNRIPLSFLLAIPRIFWRYKRGKLDAHNYSDVMDEMVGLPQKTLNDIAENCFERKIKKDIYPEMKRIIEDYHKQQIPIILATSSPAFIIQPLAEYLEADILIATEIEFKDGKTTGRFDGEPNFREVKLRRIEKLIEPLVWNFEKCIFYSDSIHDLSTLEFIGRPITVNPDFLLRTVALERDWPILRPTLKT